MRIDFAIIKYELQKIFTDKHAMFSLLLMPLMYGLLCVVSSALSVGAAYQSSYHIYFLGQEMETVEVPLMEDCSLFLLGSKVESFEEFRQTDTYSSSDVVVEFSDHQIAIYYDSTDVLGDVLKESAKNYVAKMQQAAFLDSLDEKPSLVEVEELNIGKQKDLTNKFASMMLPYLFIMTLLSNCLNFVSDHFAGEKERGVFEKMLLAPIKENSILLGKMVANSLVGLTSSFAYFVSLFAFSALMNILRPSSVTNLTRMSVSSGDIILLLIGAVLLSLLFSGLGMICSMLARTSKDTGNYTVFIFGITFLLAFVAIYRSGGVSNLYYTVPVYNICLLFQDMINGELLLSSLFTTIGCSLVYVILVFLAQLKLFQMELVRY